MPSGFACPPGRTSPVPSWSSSFLLVLSCPSVARARRFVHCRGKSCATTAGMPRVARWPRSSVERRSASQHVGSVPPCRRVAGCPSPGRANQRRRISALEATEREAISPRAAREHLSVSASRRPDPPFIGRGGAVPTSERGAGTATWGPQRRRSSRKACSSLGKACSSLGKTCPSLPLRRSMRRAGESDSHSWLRC
jgi:hypothetical protein